MGLKPQVRIKKFLQQITKSDFVLFGEVLGCVLRGSHKVLSEQSTTPVPQDDCFSRQHRTMLSRRFQHIAFTEELSDGSKT